MVFANDFIGACDSDILQSAVQNRDSDGIVVIDNKVDLLLFCMAV